MSHGIVSTSRRVTSARRFNAEMLDLVTETPPTVFPVTLAEARLFLRVDGTDQDDVITGLISAATSWAEGVTRRAFVQRSLDVRYAETPPAELDMVLALPPVSALTEVTYEDEDGAAQTIELTDLELEPLFGRVRLAPDATITDWPDVFSINFRYVCGFSPASDDAADIPDLIKQGILGKIASMYETRIDQPVGAQVSQATDHAAVLLLNDFRVRGF